MKELTDYSLLRHNTFGMDVRTAHFVEYESVEELCVFLKQKNYELPLLHIGRGSNLLFSGDYQGTVLHSLIKGYEVVSETSDTVDVRVGAGEVWDDFVAYTVQKNLYGAVNLSLIP
ncbi:FAD-binding protein, partial [Phocaeicola coprocola]